MKFKKQHNYHAARERKKKEARPRSGSAQRLRPFKWMERHHPGQALQMMRVAARARVTGATWSQVAEQSGISMSTLTKWDSKPETQQGANWQAIKADVRQQLQREANKGNSIADAALRGDPDNPQPYVDVTVENVDSPEQLCDRYGVQLAKVLLDTAFDPNVSRGVRKDSAREALALGGHSPINKSVVISAPIENKETAQALIKALGECRSIRDRRDELIAPYTGDALQLEHQPEAG